MADYLEAVMSRPKQPTLWRSGYTLQTWSPDTQVGVRRPETENYTSHLARRLLEGIRRHGANPNKPLRILDLGTGTGCIPLLLHASLSKLIPNIRIVGIDISPKAIELARRNVRWNIAQLNLDISARRQVSFQLGDILEMSKECKNTICTTPILQTDWDVVTSNPPYISPKAFRTTSRSVRNFEPGLALVPPPQNGIKLGETTELGHATNEGDTLYPGILDIATKVNTKLAVLEVSDLEQAIRVASIALDTGHWDAVEVWRDSLNFNGPQASEGKAQPNQLVVEGHKIILWGDGNARAVVCRKNY
ncbi:MAG: hypothetical protein M1836_004382 [Candelina mexicana]|nr:MAG: hypothetical protein M1836_004382 [Candelina mexicana]